MYVYIYIRSIHAVAAIVFVFPVMYELDFYV